MLETHSAPGGAVRFARDSLAGSDRPHCASIDCEIAPPILGTANMTDRAETEAKVMSLIEPFNKKGVVVTEATRFAQDLEWDSLTVLDFVANIEDEFDIVITMNQQAEIETVGQLVDAVGKLKAG
jgi:acyl carrier protein